MHTTSAGKLLFLNGVHPDQKQPFRVAYKYMSRKFWKLSWNIFHSFYLQTIHFKCLLKHKKFRRYLVMGTCPNLEPNPIFCYQIASVIKQI